MNINITKQSCGRGTVKVLSLFLTVSSLLTMTSCSDFFDVDSRHAAKEEQQWTSVADTRSALMGVYALTRSAIASNNLYWLCGELPMGDFTVRESGVLASIAKADFSSDNDTIRSIKDYSRFYTAINAAAVFMENAYKTEANDMAYSEQNLKWDVAQARALRAFLYYMMARIYGDVPLVKYSYDNGVFADGVEPSSQEAILTWAKSEMQVAAENLPQQFGSSSNKYYDQEPSYWQGILFNQSAAWAVLAHISAMMNNYADCASYCQKVIDGQTIGTTTLAKASTVASIISSTGLFSSDSRTYAANRLLAFVFPYSGGEARREGHLESLTLASPYVRRQYPDIYVSRDTLSNLYNETTDERLGIDTTKMTYNNNFIDMNTTYPIFKKVNVIQDGSASDVDYSVFSSAIVFSRLEEIILLKAEAAWALGDNTEASDRLNEVRTARGLGRVTLSYDFKNDRRKLLDAIFKERRRELIGEGWRWYDILRRQKLLKDDQQLLQRIKNKDIYWK